MSLPGFHLQAGTKAVFVVADNSCMGCNKAFAETAADYLTRQDVQFVVSASEGNIDLSQYLKMKGAPNIFIDDRRMLTDNALINGSTILFLQNGDADTTLQVDATKLEEQLGYIKTRMQH